MIIYNYQNDRIIEVEATERQLKAMPFRQYACTVYDTDGVEISADGHIELLTGCDLTKAIKEG